MCDVTNSGIAKKASFVPGKGVCLSVWALLARYKPFLLFFLCTFNESQVWVAFSCYVIFVASYGMLRKLAMFIKRFFV